MPPSTEPLRIGGILLAAGASDRFGANKLLHPVGGRALIESAASAARDAGLTPLVAVLGRDGAALRALLQPYGFRCLLHPESASASASLHHGLEVIAPAVDAVVILLGDMPLVSAAMITALANAAGQSAAPVVASRYGGVVAPPVLFRRALFPELLAWQGDGGPRPVVERHQSEALFVDWPAGALVDVDERDDLARLAAADATSR